MRYGFAIGLTVLAQLFADSVDAEEAGTRWPPTRWTYEWPAPVPSEAAKGAMMAEALGNAEVEYHFGPPGWPDEFPPRPPEMPLTAWCPVLIDAIKTQRDVTYIEPVVRAETYDDPALKPWQDRCPTLAFNYQREYFTRKEALSAGLPASEPDGTLLLVHAYTTRDFRLYEIELDGNPDNGKEVVFSGQRAYYYLEAVRRLGLPEQPPPTDRNWNDVLPPESVPGDLAFTPGQYTQLNLHHCVAGYFEGGLGPRKIDEDYVVEADSGFLVYGGYPYFFEFERVTPRQGSEPHWRIIITGFPLEDYSFPNEPRPKDLCVVDFH